MGAKTTTKRVRRLFLVKNTGTGRYVRSWPVGGWAEGAPGDWSTAREGSLEVTFSIGADIKRRLGEHGIPVELEITGKVQR